MKTVLRQMGKVGVWLLLALIALSSPDIRVSYSEARGAEVRIVQVDAQAQSLPYTQPFDTGVSNNSPVTALTGWTGDGTIVNYNNNTPPYMLATGTLSSLNLTVSDFHLKVSNFFGSNGTQIRFRIMDANNFYYLQVSNQYSSGYSWHKVVASVDTKIGSDFTTYINSGGGFGTVEINALGNTLSMRAYVTGGTAPSYGNSQTDSQFASGKLAFGNNSFIDTLSVDSLSSALTPGTAATPTVVSATSLGLSASAATGGSGAVAVQWQKAADSGGVAGTYSDIAGATSLTYTDSPLTTGVKVWYRLKYVDTTPTTVYSNEVSATPSAALTANGVTFSSVSQTGLTVTTTAATGGTSPYYYQFQRSADNGSNGPVGASNSDTGWTNFGTNSTGTSQPDSGLTAGTKYWYRVKVVDQAGSGTVAYGQSSSQTTSSSATLAATPAFTSATTSQVVISVTASGGTSPYTYSWVRSTTVDFQAGTTTALSGQTTATCTDTPPDSEIYFYRCTVGDAASNSVTTTTTPAGKWDAPLNVGFIGDSSLKFGSGQGASTTSYWQEFVRRVKRISIRSVLFGASTSSSSQAAGHQAQAQDGSTSAQWMSGQTLLTNAITNMTTAGCTHVVYRIGANDVTTAWTNGTTFYNNVKNTIDTLLNAGFKVYFAPVSWYVGAADAYNDRVRQCIAAAKQLKTYYANNSNVTIGGFATYRWSTMRQDIGGPHYPYSGTESGIANYGGAETAASLDAMEFYQGFLAPVQSSTTVYGQKRKVQ